MESNVSAPEEPVARGGGRLRLAIVLGAMLAVALVVGGIWIGAQFGTSGSSAQEAAGATPSASVDRVARAAAFVDCMRKNGVPNFPDPGPDGMLKLGPGDGVDVSSDAFKNASEACKAFKPSGGGGNGQQPQGPPPSADTKDFVACMRSNGVPDFPDPVNGVFNYNGPAQDKVLAAHEACKKFLPSDAPPPRP
jgi:hypothetical protein